MRSVIAIFWAQFGVFIVTVAVWLGLWRHWLPHSFRWMTGTVFPGLVVVLLAIGCVLWIQTAKQGKAVSGDWLRWSLLLTGIASAATGGGILLHNVLEGLSGVVGEGTMLRSILEALSVLFFFVGIGAPLLLLGALLCTAVLLLWPAVSSR